MSTTRITHSITSNPLPFWEKVEFLGCVFLGFYGALVPIGLVTLAMGIFDKPHLYCHINRVGQHVCRMISGPTAKLGAIEVGTQILCLLLVSWRVRVNSRGGTS